MLKLSIITINYNNEEGLRKTFDSVFIQNCKDFEYLVIDGASTDESKKLIQANADKIAYWVCEKDNGVYDAMNKGIQKAAGEFIMFLNSGDYLINNNVLNSAIKFTENKKADVYFGNIQLQNEEGTVYSLKYPAVLTLDFWEKSTINHQASLIKASLFRELGFYDSSYSLAADYAFYLKSYFYGKQFEYINEDWVHYPLDGISNLNEDQYRLQMKTAWKNIIPVYLDTLYKEHKAHTLLMQHRLMQLAKNLNYKYKIFKSFFIK